jgi:hypothetical protein
VKLLHFTETPGSGLKPISFPGIGDRRSWLLGLSCSSFTGDPSDIFDIFRNILILENYISNISIKKISYEDRLLQPCGC